MLGTATSSRPTGTCRTFRVSRLTKVVCASSPSPYQHPSRSPGLLSLVGRGALSAKAALVSMAENATKDVNAEELNAQIKESVKSMRMWAMVVPFAAVSGSTDTFFIITKAVASFIKVRWQRATFGPLLFPSDCPILTS